MIAGATGTRRNQEIYQIVPCAAVFSTKFGGLGVARRAVPEISSFAGPG
jgi:hypothetical protein